MDKPLSTTPALSIGDAFLFSTGEESIEWLRSPRMALRMASDDDVDDDEWTDDDLEDDDLDGDLDDDWDDDDLDDDDLDDDLDDDDFEDDFEDDDGDDDDYEYEYRGDTGWDDGEDEYDLLGARFSSLLHDPSTGPRRFKDRDGMLKSDKKPKKSRRQRATPRRQDEIENDDD